MTPPPSRAFGCAAAMGVAAASPGLVYVAWHVIDVVAHGARVEDLLLLLGVLALGPLFVIGSAVRMMRRPDRPVAIFVVALLLTCVPTLLLLGLSTFGPDNGGIALGCLAALVAALAAALTAVVAAVRARAERRT